jgi:hypothetical protein
VTGNNTVVSGRYTRASGSNNVGTGDNASAADRNNNFVTGVNSRATGGRNNIVNGIPVEQEQQRPQHQIQQQIQQLHQHQQPRLDIHQQMQLHMLLIQQEVQGFRQQIPVFDPLSPPAVHVPHQHPPPGQLFDPPASPVQVLHHQPPTGQVPPQQQSRPAQFIKRVLCCRTKHLRTRMTNILVSYVWSTRRSLCRLAAERSPLVSHARKRSTKGKRWAKESA